MGRWAADEWCCRKGLNFRPPPYQGGALPLSYGSARRERISDHARPVEACGLACDLAACGPRGGLLLLPPWRTRPANPARGSVPSGSKRPCAPTLSGARRRRAGGPRSPAHRPFVPAKTGTQGPKVADSLQIGLDSRWRGNERKLRPHSPLTRVKLALAGRPHTGHKSGPAPGGPRMIQIMRRQIVRIVLSFNLSGSGSRGLSSGASWIVFVSSAASV